MITKRGFLLALAASASISAICPASAEVYPARPVTVIVPFPAGGPVDTIGRILAESIHGSLGQPVTIENVAGAAGSIGVGRVARATSDGYTLGIGIMTTHVLNGAVYTLQYDAVKDFEPIALVARTSLVIVARKSMPAEDLNLLIAWLKANPNRASQATAGVGSPQHIAGAFFQSLTGTKLQFVPYRGAAPAMQDLVSGQVDMDIDAPAIALPQIRSGAIKGYAVAAKRRLAAAPEIPTADEAGLPGFHFSDWFALFAPRGIPRDVTVKLNGAAAAALNDAAVRQRITDLGLEIPLPEEQTPAALGAQQQADIEKWWPFIKAAGIKAE
jgi:tripartite-type tricarboxylate transporter receptor subunit TctC